jgi:hypothetical protein
MAQSNSAAAILESKLNNYRHLLKAVVADG